MAKEETVTGIAGDLLPLPGHLKEAVDLVEKYFTPRVITVKGTPDGKPVELLLSPQGMDVTSVKEHLDEYREKPERRQGMAIFTRLEGLIDHANRFKHADSALFALDDPKAPRLTCVLDYHPTGEDNTAARFARHRGLYQFPLSPEWQAWMARNGQAMDSGAFYEFLEEHAVDIAPAELDLVNAPLAAAGEGLASEGMDMGTKRLRDMARLLGADFAGPTELLTLARGLKVRVDGEVEEARNINTGEEALVFKETHKNKDGAPLKVPNLFAIHIPVFKMGAIYKLGVRLRYRLLPGGKVAWIYQIHRADWAFTDAMDEACEKARDATGLPLFYGNPE